MKRHHGEERGARWTSSERTYLQLSRSSKAKPPRMYSRGFVLLPSTVSHTRGEIGPVRHVGRTTIRGVVRREHSSETLQKAAFALAVVTFL